MPLNHGIRRVLLIEDDDDDCEVFGWAIKDISKDIQLEICTNCIEAPERIASFLPEIIFLDLRLPFKHGLVYLEELQAQSTTKEIPIVIYSSYSNPEEIDKAIQLGATIYLEKPDSFTKLIQSLQHILTSKPRDLAALEALGLSGVTSIDV